MGDTRVLYRSRVHVAGCSNEVVNMLHCYRNCFAIGQCE